ncbi:hypothetical protein vseg_004425 [Gypsophila vaccaria]
MSEHVDTLPHDSFVDNLADKLHLHLHDNEKVNETHNLPHHSSSSSDDEADEKRRTVSSSSPPPPPPPPHPSAASAIKAKISRLFGRQKPLHQVLGGGQPADVFLWRNKKISAGVLGTATLIWIFFELLEYHLLTLVCHVSIFSLAGLFLWSNANTFINKSPPNFPELSLPEQPFLQIAAALGFELNRAFSLLHDIALGKDLKKFLYVIAGLWLLSIVGKSCDFLTLVYINFVLLHTVPVLYEKHEDKVDAFAERALAEAKKHYGVVNERYISKIPRGPLKTKKAD